MRKPDPFQAEYWFASLRTGNFVVKHPGQGDEKMAMDEVVDWEEHSLGCVALPVVSRKLHRSKTLRFL
jgi:hypothetical protein